MNLFISKYQGIKKLICVYPIMTDLKFNIQYSSNCVEDLTSLYELLRKIVDISEIVCEIEKNGNEYSQFYRSQLDYISVYSTCVENIWKRISEESPDVSSEILYQIDTDDVNYTDVFGQPLAEPIKNATMKSRAVYFVLRWIKEIEAADAIAEANVSTEISSIIARKSHKKKMRA